MIRVIEADGTITRHEGPVTLEQAQAWVGGYVEMVKLGPLVQMIVNEEGQLEQLPLNPMASMFAGMEIVGTVVVLAGEDQWE